MKKVIFINEPAKKKTKPVKLTHVQTASGWTESIRTNYKHVEKLVYLGKCAVDGDLFAAYFGCYIEIYKGELNDGTY
jgi:hypothetical protein